MTYWLAFVDTILARYGGTRLEYFFFFTDIAGQLLEHAHYDHFEADNFLFSRDSKV